VYLIVLTGLLAYFIFGIWPAELSNEGAGQLNVVNMFGTKGQISAEVNLILVAMAVGALGGNVHAIRSFALFVGNRQLVSSWVWWLLMRPFLGLPMALIFYFLARAGFLAGGAHAEDLNPFGIGAVSG